MSKNLFITFEGIDGSGKSTQSRLLADHLISLGHKVHLTFEPTRSPIGSLIRDVFSHQRVLNQKTIAALFVADRLEHILSEEDGILKMLSDGYTVICDRYYFSSFAYQSEYMPLEWIIRANEEAMTLARPDMQIYIDVDPALSMQRINQGREAIELYETLDNLTGVKNRYDSILKQFADTENISRFNGNQSPEALFTEIVKVVEDAFSY